MATIVIAVHNYSPPVGHLDNKLALKKGDKIRILKQDNSGWWHGVKEADPSQHGWFPASYTKLLPQTSNDKEEKSTAVTPKIVDKDLGKIPLPSNTVAANTTVAQTLSNPSAIEAATERDEDDDYGDMSAIEKQIQDSQKIRAAVPLKLSETRTRNIPANWNWTKTIDGRSYIYNHLTNKTAWRIEDIDRADTTEEESQIPEIAEFEAKKIPQDGYNEYILDIVNAISRLNDALIKDERTRYFRLSRKVVQSMQSLFMFTNNTNYDLYSKETNNLMKAASVFVLAVKSARAIWPPPDSKRRVRESSSLILKCVKSYISAVKDSGTVTSEVKNFNINEISRSNSISEDPDAVSQIDGYAARIKVSVDSLLDYIQKTTKITNASSGKSYAQEAAQWRVIECTNEVVKDVGEILNFIEDIQFYSLEKATQNYVSSSLDHDDPFSPNVIRDRLSEFKELKENVQEFLSLVMAAASVAADSFAPQNATREVLIKMSTMLKSVKELIAVVKILISTKEVLDDQQIYQKFQAIGMADDKLGQMKPRGSMNELHDSQWDLLNSKKKSNDSFSVNSMSSDTLSEMKSTRRVSDHNNFPQMRPRSSKTGNDVAKYRMTVLADAIGVPGPLQERSSKRGSFASATESNLLMRNQPRSSSTSGESKLIKSDSAENFEYVNRKLSKASVDSVLSTTNKIKKFFGEDADVDEARKSITGRANSAAQQSNPWYLSADYHKRDLIYTMDSNPKVKSGTVEALVAKLTSHESFDSEFTNSFLYTFRLFLEPRQFLKLLIERFHLKPPTEVSTSELSDWNDRKRVPVRLRVFKTVKKWIEEFWYPDTDKVVIPDIKTFAKDQVALVLSREAEKLIELCKKRENATKNNPAQYRLSLTNSIVIISPENISKPAPIIPKVRLSAGGKAILEVDPIEIARQLTLIESNLFMKINPVEFLFYKPDEKSSAGHIRQMISVSNHVTGWVAETILLEKDVKKRSHIIRHFIKVAERCHTMKNYATRQSVLAALNSTPIYRLKKTWEVLPAKAKSAFDTLSKLMDRENNFITYRKTLKTTIPPCVPFIGLYLTDIIFTKQGNPDKVSENRLINFDKYMKLSTVIDEINRFQSANYQFYEILEVQEDLESLLTNSRDIQELHDLSLIIEPREKTMVRSSSTEHADEQESVFQSLIDKGFM